MEVTLNFLAAHLTGCFGFVHLKLLGLSYAILFAILYGAAFLTYNAYYFAMIKAYAELEVNKVIREIIITWLGRIDG